MTSPRISGNRRQIDNSNEPDFELRPAVLVGETADIYFHRSLSVLRDEQINPVVVMDFVPERSGILCGIKEVKALLTKVLPEDNLDGCFALLEGDTIDANEVVLRIKAPYSNFGLYETAICGILAQSTGWASAAHSIVEAAHEIPVICYGARHVHPNVVPILDYSSVIGGCVACSTALGAKLAGVTPSGTMPHAMILCVGDTVKSVQLFDKHMPPEVPRIALVDTFRDEAQESIAVADALKGKLRGVRLDTPRERGKVTPELVKEVRARLDQSGYQRVEIFVSGGLTLERVKEFVESGCPIDAFGIGTEISSAKPNNFTADIHEIDGKPIAKRGRIPGVETKPRLQPLF